MRMSPPQVSSGGACNTQQRELRKRLLQATTTTATPGFRPASSSTSTQIWYPLPLLHALPACLPTEEHVREYLGEVLSYFWAERAEAFAAGAVPPLGEQPLAH